MNERPVADSGVAVRPAIPAQILEGGVIAIGRRHPAERAAAIVAAVRAGRR